MKAWENPGFLETKKGGTGRCLDDVMDLSFLNGKYLVETGFVDGGFAIDYQDGDKTMRVVLEWNNLGLWIEWHGEKGKPNPEDLLREKIESVWDDLCGQAESIRDLPTERRYSFVDGDGKELLSLNLSELMLMGADVCRHFHKEKKDLDEVVISISSWMF